MYPEFAKTAREEGFEEIAKIFLAIAVAEKQHEKVFLALKANVDQGSVFKKDKIVVWRCRNCGYIPRRHRGAGTLPGLQSPNRPLRDSVRELVS